MGGFNDQRVSQKVIIIMTDGENHEGDPVEAARQAAAEGAVIYTVGFGSPEGVPVADYDEQEQRDRLPAGCVRAGQSCPGWTKARFNALRRLAAASTSGLTLLAL